MNPQAKFSVALCRELRHFVVQDLEGSARQNSRYQRKVGINGRSVGDQTIKRNECCNCRKDSQQRIEGDAGRNSEQSIVVDARVNSPKDVLPSPRRNMPRRLCASTSTRFPCPTNLLRNRLVVLEVLLRPFVGFWIALRRRDPAGRRARIFSVAVARKSERYQSAIGQKRPYFRVLRHVGVLKPFCCRQLWG